MENAIRDRFLFTYESGVSGSFLVVSASTNESIMGYQVEMLSNNPNKNILPLDVRRKNDRINIYYNITSKLALSQYLRRSKLSRNEFIDIFSCIIRILLNSKGLLLSDKSFLLDEEYIYLSPDTMEISLVYLPIRIDLDITRVLKDFAINFVVYSANIDEKNGDSFLEKVLGFLKKDTFNILEFDRFLKDLRRSTEPYRESESGKVAGIPEDKIVPLHIEEDSKQSPKESDHGLNRLNVEIPKPKSRVPLPPKKNPTVNPGEAKSREKKLHKQGEDKTNLMSFDFKSNVLVLGISIQAAIVIFIIILLSTGALDFLGSDKAGTAFGVLLIGGAASFYLWKKVLAWKNPQDTKCRVSYEEKKTPEEDMKTPKSSIPFKTSSGSTEQERKHVTVNGIKHVDATVMLKSDVNATVLLGHSNIRYPYLQVYREGTLSEVTINKPNFIIGRLKGQVDYVDSNNAVGKVHAEIITRKGCYFVKDLNSRNGTYINGERIESNKEYEIKNNDKITLANSEFVFIVP